MAAKPPGRPRALVELIDEAVTNGAVLETPGGVVGAVWRSVSLSQDAKISPPAQINAKADADREARELVLLDDLQTIIARLQGRRFTAKGLAHLVLELRRLDRLEAARRGGLKAQREGRADRELTRKWCEQRLADYSSLNKLRDAAVAAKLGHAKPDTIRYWLSEWVKEWRADGRWTQS
jgi:hypothetical protein